MFDLTPEYLKTRVSYDPKTGTFTYLYCPRFKNNWNSRFAMKPALISISDKGYLYGRIDSKHVYAHRAAYMIMTGKIPDEVDHIDGNTINNVWENLRNADRTEQSKNQSIRSNNKSGHLGVWYDKSRNKWVSQIADHGKRVSIGYFENIDDAVKARKDAEIRYCYHPNHGRIKNAV